MIAARGPADCGLRARAGSQTLLRCRNLQPKRMAGISSRRRRFRFEICVSHARTLRCRSVVAESSRQRGRSRVHFVRSALDDTQRPWLQKSARLRGPEPNLLALSAFRCSIARKAVPINDGKRDIAARQYFDGSPLAPAAIFAGHSVSVHYSALIWRNPAGRQGTPFAGSLPGGR